MSASVRIRGWLTGECQRAISGLSGNGAPGAVSWNHLKIGVDTPPDRGALTMLLLIVFGLYFIVLGAATLHQREFHFTAQFAPQPITGRAATIAAQANIGAGVLVALAALLADPVPLVGVAALVFCVGLCAAFTCAGRRVQA